MPAWLLPAIATVAGAVGNLLSSKSQYKDVLSQVKEQNRNLQKSAEKVENLAVSEGVNQQAAYNWAANMVRKYQNNPNAIESVSNIAANRLQTSSDRAGQYRAAAIEYLSKKLSRPRKPGVSDYLTSFLEGGAGGLSLAASAKNAFRGKR